MKAGAAKWAVAVLLSILAASCSSIRARTAIPDQDWTVYPGIQQDAKDLDDVFGGKRPEPGWLNGVVASMLIFDLPFSAVFDTLAMPYDLYRIDTPKASEASREASGRSSPPKATQSH